MVVDDELICVLKLLFEVPGSGLVCVQYVLYLFEVLTFHGIQQGMVIKNGAYFWAASSGTTHRSQRCLLARKVDFRGLSLVSTVQDDCRGMPLKEYLLLMRQKRCRLVEFLVLHYTLFIVKNHLSLQSIILHHVKVILHSGLNRFKREMPKRIMYGGVMIIILMKVLGIGIDLVMNMRIEQILTKNYAQRFIRKFLHEQQLRHYFQMHNECEQVEFVASRWAVKEALAKAIGRKELAFNQINIIKDTHGKPLIAIEGDDNERLFLELQIGHCHVSITHEKEYTIGTAIVEER